MQPIATTHAYFDAWNQQDGDAIAALFVEGGTYSDPLVQDLTGSAIAAYAKGLWEAYPDLSFEIVSEAQKEDGLVAVQWIMRGTNHGPFQGLPPSGKKITLPGADFIQVEGDRLRSVQGYFDSSAVPRQLGLQVIVQPQTVGPFAFGTGVQVQSGKKTKPRAFSITALYARSDDEVQQIRDLSRRIATEMLDMEGFIGWVGTTVGRHMFTITAWEDAEQPRQLMQKGAHVEATKSFFGPELASSGWTSVWIPGRYNANWVRCTTCERMVDYTRAEGVCACGARLPEPPAYW